MILKARLLALSAMREAIRRVRKPEGLDAAAVAEFDALLAEYSRDLSRAIGDCSTRLSLAGEDARALLAEGEELAGAATPAAPAPSARILQLVDAIRAELSPARTPAPVRAIHVAPPAVGPEPKDELELKLGLLPLEPYGVCAFRKALGLRQGELAREVPCTQAMLSAMESRLRREPKSTIHDELRWRYRNAVANLADLQALRMLARNSEEVIRHWGPMDGRRASRAGGDAA